MILYYIIVLLILFSIIIKNKLGKCIGWIVFVLMAYMTMFRGDNVGTDTMNYLRYNAEHRIEEYFVTGIVSLIFTGTFNERAVIYATCFVTYFFAFLNIRKYKIDVRYFCLFFFIYSFFAMGLNISRQIAAIVIVANFLPYIFDKSKKKSLLFFVGCILGAGFHISSLLLVYLYVLRFVKISNKNDGLIIFLLGSAILLNILPMASIMQKFLPNIYADEYSGDFQRNEGVSIIGYIYRLFTLGIYAYIYKYLSYRKDIWLYGFSAIMVNGTIGMDPSISRIFYINSYIIIIYSCLAYTSYNMKKDNKLKMLFWFQTLMGLYMTLSFMKNHPDLNRFEFI